MSYSQHISRAYPGCVIFLIDQSGSMDEPFGTTGKPKSKIAADIVNKAIGYLVIKCMADDENPRDYFDVGAIGYHTDGSGYPRIMPVVGDKEIMPISELADLGEVETGTVEEYDGLGNLKEREVLTQTWVKPMHQFGTPMCRALRTAERIISNWIIGHPDSFPPMVFNITDGEASDGSPTDVIAAAQLIKNLATSYGNSLVYNCYISSQHTDRISYPGSPNDLPDEYARTLFAASSLIPIILIDDEYAPDWGIQPGAYGFVINSDIDLLIKLLIIGSQHSRGTLR